MGEGRVGEWSGLPTAQADCACVRSSRLFDLNLRRLTEGSLRVTWGFWLG